MKTAEEIRRLMPEHVADSIIAEFEKAAAKAAADGRNEIGLYSVIDKAGWPASHEVHQYVYERKPTALMQKVESTLVAAGYKVRAHYEEKQFVDMNIIVSWSTGK